MVKITKKSADNCTEKIPSYKGEKKSFKLPDTIDPEIVAYSNADYNYWVTKPQIDNIVILGNPNIVGEEEERGFQKKLDGEHLEAQKRGKDPTVERVPQKKDQKKKSGYNHHFKVWYRPKNYAVHLFFGPRHKNQRFLKLDFSPWRLGPDGMDFFRCWYDETVYHSTFDQLISADHAIKSIDGAIDILGVHFADLVINLAEGVISNTYFGDEGRAETAYIFKENQTKKIIYNKAKNDHKYSFITPYAGFYSDGFPVTRVEFRRKFGDAIKDQKSFNQLYNSVNNPYASMPVLWPKRHKNIQYDFNWDLFLDSVRYRGLNSAAKKLPDDLQKKYRQRMEKILHDLFQPYHNSKTWKEWWRDGIDYLKITPEIGVEK